MADKVIIYLKDTPMECMDFPISQEESIQCRSVCLGVRNVRFVLYILYIKCGPAEVWIAVFLSCLFIRK